MNWKGSVRTDRLTVMSGWARWKSGSRGISQVVASVGTTAIWMLRPMPVRLTRPKVNLLDLIQMVTDPPSVLGAVFGQRNAASHPGEQLHAQPRLQAGDLPVDGAMGQGQFLGRAGKLPSRADASKACSALRLGMPFLMADGTPNGRPRRAGDQ